MAGDEGRVLAQYRGAQLQTLCWREQDSNHPFRERRPASS
jgi:hypothetical protein